MENLGEILPRIFSRPEFLLPYLIWVSFWKSLALWKAAGRKQISWFVILFLVNSLGLLELAYIFYLYRWDLGGKKMLKFLKNKTKFFKIFP